MGAWNYGNLGKGKALGMELWVLDLDIFSILPTHYVWGKDWHLGFIVFFRL